MPTYRTLAIVDDVNTCDCCGKTNLKLTVAMERDDGEIVHFGSVCATRHSGRGLRVIKSEAREIAEQKREFATNEYRASAEYIAYQARLAQGHREKVRAGTPFMEFCRDASHAASAKAHEIAKKYNVPCLSA